MKTLQLDVQSPTDMTNFGSGIASYVFFKAISMFFDTGPVSGRAMELMASGMTLRDEYKEYDAGSDNLFSDRGHNELCRCAKVITGSEKPHECPLFGSLCTPLTPQGACMVSSEGSCHSYFANRRR